MGHESYYSIYSIGYFETLQKQIADTFDSNKSNLQIKLQYPHC